MENMKGLFDLDRSGAVELARAAESCRVRLYLVDDVYTTGSTMTECARVLRQSLPVEVYGITWAR
jgi:competence protein ComFC